MYLLSSSEEFFGLFLLNKPAPHQSLMRVHELFNQYFVNSSLGVKERMLIMYISITPLI